MKEKEDKAVYLIVFGPLIGVTLGIVFNQLVWGIVGGLLMSSILYAIFSE